MRKWILKSREISFSGTTVAKQGQSRLQYGLHSNYICIYIKCYQRFH